MDGKKEVRIRRIGTVTFGIMLIFFGLLFLLHMFWPKLTYLWIFHLWPMIFISLGVEILLSAVKREERLLYDGMAMFMMAFLTFFAMGMAAADLLIQYQEKMYLF